MGERTLDSGRLIFGAFVVAASSATFAGLMFSQLLRQHGRILLRLEALEGRSDGRHAQNTNALPVGARFPEFRLPDPTGRSISLTDYAGKRVLLLNWSPSCGFCERIAPDLANLAPALRERNGELVLVASGNVDANTGLLQRHGLRCELMLSDGSPTIAPFAGQGTPVAYVLDGAGVVTSGPLIGADQVVRAARELSLRPPRLGTERPLSESRLRRDGIPPGTPAPKFALEDVSGKRVALDDYAGQRVMLVFSDPHCGPCDSLLPHLLRLNHQERSRISLLMISRGDPAENRRKVIENNIRFPVLIQPGWSVSKDYGIFATPAAFLVDQRGFVAEKVAVGADAVLGLLRRETSKEVAMQH